LDLLGEWESNPVYDEDSELIERYVAVQYGPLKWSAEKLSKAHAGDV
jgi:hypothetical protein